MTEQQFNETWEKIIKPRCEYLVRTYGGLVFLPDDVKKQLCNYYEEARVHAKNHYMKDPSGRLNRYKVAGALMVAILQAKPLKKVDSKFYEKSKSQWTFNEAVALYTGLSIVRNFIMLDIKKAEEGGSLSEDQTIQKELFENGLPLDEDDQHRWETEIYHMREEGCCNTLVFAHELEDYVKLRVANRKIVVLTKCIAARHTT